jgi:hypothetical protein
MWQPFKGKAALVQVLKAGVLYFVLVFGTGFAIGAIRVTWVTPRLGTRTAELLEAPFMFVVTILAARWTVRRFDVPPHWPYRLGMGVIALWLMLFAEFTLVLWIQRLSIGEYLATRDPVSGAVYYAMLMVFAAMPLLVLKS